MVDFISLLYKYSVSLQKSAGRQDSRFLLANAYYVAGAEERRSKNGVVSR